MRQSKIRIKTALVALALLGSLCASGFALAETVNKTINRANEAAGRQDYPEAIGLYESAVQREPKDQRLKNNLAVLYANYGVALQEQKDYEGARQYFDKALALSPQSQDVKNIQDSKAGTFYSEAMDMRANSQQATATPSSAPEYGRMKDLLEQAIAINPNETAFRKGMASVYLDEAYGLASQERYAEAAPLLEQAMTFDNQSESLRTSLANVYLGLARNDATHRKEWTDKALATDNGPSIQHAVELLNAPPVIVPASSVPTSVHGKKKSFATPPGELKNRAPRDISRLSVVDMLRDMENQLQIQPDSQATLQQRLEVVEKQVVGSVQSGPLATRTKSAYVALMGSPDVATGNGLEVVQAPVASSENSYLDQIFKMTDGKVVRWGKFPLRVYVETPKDNPLFKEEYKEAALRGLNVWKDATQGFTNYVEVKNPDAADIQITWAEQYIDRFADSENAPTLYKTYVPPKRTHLNQVLQVASMVTPGYFSLAPQAVNAAMQYKQYKKLTVLRDESIMKLGLAPTKDLSANDAALLVQNMAAKEFGHALGLKGNSSKPGDLLYPELKSTDVQKPSSRDLETLRELYDRPANIVLNAH